MRGWRAVVAVLCSALSVFHCGELWASGASCTRYVIGGWSGPGSTDRLAYAHSLCAAPYCYGVCDASFTTTGGTYGAGYVNIKQTPSEVCGSTASGSMHFQASGTMECPPDPCEYTLALNDLGGTVRNGSGSTEGTFCADTLQGSETIMSCRVKVAGVVARSGDNWAAQVQWLGESCGGGDTASGDDTAPNCASTSSGMFCASKSKPNCGTVNGQAVCLDKVPEGTCEFLADGGMVCAAGASTPPAPSDGMGDPATPDGSLGYVDPAGDSYEFNYYTSTTVSGSSTGASGAQPGTSAGGGLTGGGDEGEESNAEGADPGAICDGTDCYGQAPAEDVDCVADIGACVGGIVSGAWASMTTGIPLLGFVSGLYEAFDEGGECPSAPLTIFDEEYDVMASACSVIDGSAALLALVFQIGWGLVGLRIMLKAQ